MTRGRRPLVRFEGVTKRFGDEVAVNDVSLEILEGEFFALLGPSGCGKTTLMRLLAGFETPDAGRILLAGEDLAGQPPHRRPVNMMFQSYALFPHLTVEQNVAFGLKGLPKPQIADRVAEMLALVRLEGLNRRRPDQLSGGQRQRVALARAIAPRPRMLLLDEPLAALDRKLREETQFELMALQQRLGMTFLIVTHDQEEAMVTADRIAVMRAGEIVQIGPPAEVYEAPSCRYVADFIGEMNQFEGVVEAHGDELRLSPPDGPSLRAARAGADVRTGDRVWFAVRPEKMVLHRQPPADPTNLMSGRVVETGYLGDWTTCRVAVAPGLVLKVALPNLARRSDRPIQRGDEVWLSFAPDAAVVLTR
jgi:putrescine transport system ATP-binding protein